MQCVSDLAKLRDSIVSRARNLRQIVSPISLPLGPEDRRALAFATIEVDNLIVGGLRQYAKSSLLRSRTAAGLRITANVQPSTTEEAAAFIIRSVNPTAYLRRFNSSPAIPERDEIAVRDPKLTERVLIDYSASNLQNFALALSLNSLVFAEAKVCRHFFAHRAKNTFEAVQSFAGRIGISGIDTTEDLLVQGRPGSGVRILDGWLAEVQTFFDLAS